MEFAICVSVHIVLYYLCEIVLCARLIVPIDVPLIHKYFILFCLNFKNFIEKLSKTLQDNNNSSLLYIKYFKI